MCNTQRIVTRTRETAKEMQAKVVAYRNPIAGNPLKPEDLTGSIQKNVSTASLAHSYRPHIIAPVPRDREGIRYGGCDF